MSRFTQAMSSGLEGLMHQTGDAVAYWPGGEEAAAVEINAIFTGMQGAEMADGSVMSDARRGELQIYADATLGVVDIRLNSDVVLMDGARWVVTELLETVGGMHRLVVERKERAQVRRGRGRW